MPTQVKIDELIRMSSAKGKVFSAIADGKKHSLATIRKMVIKHGASGSGIGAVYGLGRILLASSFPKRVVLDREADTVQLVSASPAKKSGATKKASKKAAKKVAAKSTVTA